MDVYIFNDLTIKYISLPFLITKVMAIFLVYIEFESISETYKELYGISLKEKISTTFGSLRDVLNKFRDLSKRK